MSSNEFKTKHSQIFFLVFAGVLFLDQLLKNIFLASGNFQKNYGALFGLEINVLYSLAIFFLFLSLVISYLCRKNKLQTFVPMLALIFSGIASNTIDKIRFGFIIDYINFFNVFIFNLADIAILLGAIIFIWQIIKE